MNQDQILISELDLDWNGLKLRFMFVTEVQLLNPQSAFRDQFPVMDSSLGTFYRIDYPKLFDLNLESPSQVI